MGTLLNRRRYMGGGSSLPYDAEVEYLDSNNISTSGVNYINTNVSAQQNDVVRITTSVAFSDINRRIVFSNYNTSYPNFSIELYVSSNKEYLRCYSSKSGGSQNKSNVSNIELPVNTFIDIDATINLSTKEHSIIFYVNNNHYLFEGDLCNVSYTNQRGIRLFFDYRETSSSSAVCHPLLMKETAIYINNTKIIDFIPVRVGQVGYMYDKISNTLFGNSGTGNFVIGPDKT